ncbi:hypothetical protein MOMA_00785 [Moraxella macacae 0408225]|uniref:Uncharacterized protein n=1 Tax=Moraxella macacae 0408225 TaxID=1230338 RepID=L2F791_9GAMM|nr:hypothetical protein [Moraxella macacae]ELA08902.1 hypothetical protein MOMA_00785 [Moraxella macacae 0408225]
MPPNAQRQNSHKRQKTWVFTIALHLILAIAIIGYWYSKQSPKTPLPKTTILETTEIKLLPSLTKKFSQSTMQPALTPAMTTTETERPLTSYVKNIQPKQSTSALLDGRTQHDGKIQHIGYTKTSIATDQDPISHDANDNQKISDPNNLPIDLSKNDLPKKDHEEFSRPIQNHNKQLQESKLQESSNKNPAISSNHNQSQDIGILTTANIKTQTTKLNPVL